MHLSFWHPVDSGRRQGRNTVNPALRMSLCLEFCKPRWPVLLLLGYHVPGVPELKGYVHRVTSQRSERRKSSQKPAGFSLLSARGQRLNRVDQMALTPVIFYVQGS